LWQQEIPPERLYDRITAEELNYESIGERHFEKQRINISYLREFAQERFEIFDMEIRHSLDVIKELSKEKLIEKVDPNKPIEDFYASNSKIKEIFFNLRQ